MSELYDFGLSRDQEENAKRLHEESIIIDGMLPVRNLYNPKYLDQVIKGGVTAGNVTVASWPDNFNRAIKKIIACKDAIKENSNKMMLATSAEDIRRAKEEGKLAVILAFQATRPIEDELSYLKSFYDMGVKIIQLTYNAQNLIGSGCCELIYGKLTYFGKEVVDVMNELGIIVDLSHCSDPTTVDAIEYSKDPCVFSHSSVRTLCNAYGRNKPDEQIKALGEKGGVMGITFFPCLIKRDPKTYDVKPSTADDVLDHIDYAVKLIGTDHVGFGTDMSGETLDEEKAPPTSVMRWWRPRRPDVFGRGPTEKYDPYPTGLDRHYKLLNLTRGLVARGYSDEDIKKILGGSFLSLLFDKVWK